MTGPYIIDDDRLVQAFRELLKPVTFDLAAEIQKETEAWNRGARMADDFACPECGKRGVIRCNCERG